ncbi:hypothetical protein D3C78_806460 [compost metagenome]
MYGLWVEQMIFPIVSPLIITTGIKHFIISVFFRESTVMMDKCLGCYFLQTNTANAGRCPSKVTIHEFRVQTHSFKDLRAPVGLNRRNPHFGKNLNYALSRSFNIVLHSLLMRDSPQ